MMDYLNCLDDSELAQERRAQREDDRKIKRLLSQHKREMKKDIKILLLGAGESGKSTFVKSMKINEGKGFDDEDRKKNVKLIHQNCLRGMTILLREMENLGLELENPISKEYKNLVLQIMIDDLERLTPGQGNFLKILWEDQGVKECFQQRHNFQIADSVEYFLDDIERLTSEDYKTADDKDMLHLRVPTSGIHEYTFAMNNRNFSIIDVGGQRGERKKWIQVFDSVKAVIFLTAISEFNQILAEVEEDSTTKKRMDESRELFGKIITNKFLKNASFIMFFNKWDLFTEKIQKHNLVDYYPEYEGPTQDKETAFEFIKSMFLKEKDQPDAVQDIFVYQTSVIDPASTKTVFDVVRANIVKGAVVNVVD